jgi:glucokinase
MKRPVLLADIGATTTRLAVARDGIKLEGVRTLPSAEIKDLPALLAETLAGAEARPTVAVLAVAGPVEGDDVALTNLPLAFNCAALKRRLKLARLHVANDFACLAHAVAALAEPDLQAIGGGHGVAKANVIVCGPGSGFGAALVLRDGKEPRVLPSEAGHMRFGAANADEARVIARLVRDHGSVAIDNVVSGPGLARLHQILAGEETTPEAVIAGATAREEKARATVDVFLRLFGRIAGDLALAFDARGGVFLAGGVSRALAHLMPGSPFRAAFEDHPPYQKRLAGVPTLVVMHPTPGLIGAAVIARRAFK